MGVPAFFRWLQGKYPKIVVPCKEERPNTYNGSTIPVDSSKPNPNGFEIDNLYLDMNGIIHPCTHPENKPAPKSEAEMMISIFEYIDRLFCICRPRRLLYMAVDGVAPRAKMNQQRSRRFRSAKESRELQESIARIKANLKAKGARLPEDGVKEHFDSNCITPGTEFMDRLSICLRYYITDRISKHSGWKNIKVILSDSNVPGEGEHKIMEYIRKQRSQPNHDPNTKHCLNGADADLIMLGLATHEAHFTIIREEFVPNQRKPCEICSQLGHEKEHCQGLPSYISTLPKPFYGREVDFLFIHLPVLKEYLEIELKVDLPFPYEFDRVIDDWVFMCFFAGNDFLPHLPSLDIREGCIDKLVNIYKRCLPKMGGYLAYNGYCNLKRVQTILIELGKLEDAIFQKRQESQAALSLSTLSISSKSPRRPSGQSRDEIRLGESGWKERYYWNKFGVYMEGDPEFHQNFASQVANEYVIGLAWVLRYYLQGCPSWKWFYPYHYAPFASDFVNVEQIDARFEKGTNPFKPLEQLMSVFPPSSGKFLPVSWREKMTNLDSEIIDFYPIDFEVDLNGKRYAWQGVALLPFVDEMRLLNCLSTVYGKMTDDEKRRNRRDDAILFIGNDNKMFELLNQLEKKDLLLTKRDIVVRTSSGMAGKVYKDELGVENKSNYPSPVQGLPDLEETLALSVKYLDPEYAADFIFPCIKLKGVIAPKKGLDARDTKVLKGSSICTPNGYSPTISTSPYIAQNMVPRHTGCNISRNHTSRSLLGTPKSILNLPNQFAPPYQLMHQKSPSGSKTLSEILNKRNSQGSNISNNIGNRTTNSSSNSCERQRTTNSSNNSRGTGAYYTGNHLNPQNNFVKSPRTPPPGKVGVIDAQRKSFNPHSHFSVGTNFHGNNHFQTKTPLLPYNNSPGYSCLNNLHQINHNPNGLTNGRFRNQFPMSPMSPMSIYGGNNVNPAFYNFNAHNQQIYRYHGYQPHR